MDGEGVEIKIEQTVICANIWKAFGLGEIKDKARQSEGQTAELLNPKQET